MMQELRRQLGHLLCVGWEHAPYADDDVTILEAAIPDRACLTGPDLAMLQRWRREHDLVWMSELLRCNGLAPLACTTIAKAGASGALRILFDRAIAGPTRVLGPRMGSPALVAWNGVRVGHWLFAMGRVGQVTEVEEAGVDVLAASLFEDGERVVRKRKARGLLATTDLARLRYTAPPMRLDNTVAREREGVVSIEHRELGAAQELERRLRRRWGRADGELAAEAAYHATSQSDAAPSDHGTIPRSVDARQPMNRMATHDTSRGTYAPRVAKSPTAGTGADWSARRAKWPPHSASCTGTGHAQWWTPPGGG